MSDSGLVPGESNPEIADLITQVHKFIGAINSQASWLDAVRRTIVEFTKTSAE